MNNTKLQALSFPQFRVINFLGGWTDSHVFVRAFVGEIGLNRDFLFADGAYLLLDQPIFNAVTVMSMATFEHSHPLLLLNFIVTYATSTLINPYIYRYCPCEH